MYKVIVLLFLLISFMQSFSFCEVVSQDLLNYYIHTNYYSLIIPKHNGMISNAQINNTDFELVSDYSSGVVGSFYTLFFPEFSPENINTTVSNYEFYIPGSDGTSVTSELKCNNDSIAVLKFKCESSYLNTIWEYNFIYNECYFKIDIDKVVEKSNVYANSQQCVMFNSDFDDTYIVDYSGNLHCTMSNNIYTYPSSATFQHTMFSAIDEGISELFPMMGWHDDEYDIIAGILSTYVSPNQRKTISYHGGGSNNQHPGFSEGQWNWFGKSDSESLFLKEGLHYSMQMYYYLNRGSISDLMDFNQNLFNENYYDLKRSESYYVASFGGRTCRLEKYFWRFPQASSDYICSQELFRHRCFSLPSSQNGTGDPHIFNLYVKHNSYDNYYDLTPIYGIESLFEEAETIQGTDHMIGSMSWIVNSLINRLNYKVFEGSDKIQISGEILTSEETLIKELFVELELSPRVSEVFSIGDSIFDIRCDDEVYEKIGITVYDLQNIEEIIVNDDHIRFYLVKNLSDSLYSEGDSFEYSFSLFPHIGYNVEGYDNITPLISTPEEYYREYYLTLPNQLGINKYGICPNLNIFPYNAIIGSDSLIFSLDIFCNQGYYPIKIFIDEPKIESVVINNEELLTWNFNEITRVLTLEKDWSEANYKIKIYNKKIHGLLTEPYFQIFPNPFKNSTYISFEFPEQVNYEINIYNIKGQLIKNFSGLASKESLLWNGKDNNNELVSNGIYLCELKVTNYCRTKKILLFNK